MTTIEDKLKAARDCLRDRRQRCKLTPDCTWDDPVKRCWMCRQDEKALAEFPDPDAVGECVEALEAIRDYPKEDDPRRTEDGYPSEVCYDEFAYFRIIDSYRKGARAGLAKLEASAPESAELEEKP